MTRATVQKLGMAEVRRRLPEIADSLSDEPDRIVVVTRRGKPVLHLVAAPRVRRKATGARRMLERVAQLEPTRRTKAKDVARRYKDLLYGA